MKARVQNTSIQQRQPSHVRYPRLATPPTTFTSIHGPSPVYFGELAQLRSESTPGALPLQPEDKRRQQAEQLAAQQALAKFAQTLSESDPVLQMKRKDKQHEEAEQLAADQELAKELQEKEEHQALLAETRAALLSSPAGPGPSTPALSSEDSPSTFHISGLPVTRVTLSNRPTITTQMNDTWMRDYDDKTKEKRRVRGNSQIDLEMVQKFRVIWWEKVCVLPFPKTTAYLLIIRLVLGLSFLRSKNVLVGQSGRSQILLLLLHGWETVPFSSMTWITIFGLRVPIHTLIPSELTVIFYSVLLGSNAMISTYTFPQHYASPSTSVLISQLFTNP